MIEIFFLGVVGVTVAAIVLLCRKNTPKAGWIALGVLIVWLGLTGAIASTGALANFSSFPPPLLLVVGITTLLTAVLALSPIGRGLANGVPLVWLTGLHAFRVLVEIFLYMGYRDGMVPVQMTFEGRNWDVMSGISAIAVAWLAAHGRLSRVALLTWNVVALGLLMNIVLIAVLSMPTPLRQFHNEPANVFVAQFPYIWLPVFLVQAAWFGHLLIFRRGRV